MVKRLAIIAALVAFAFTQKSFAQFDFRTISAPRYELRGTNGYPSTTCASNWGCMAYDYSQQAFVCSKNGGGWGPCVFGTTGGGSGVTSFNGRTGGVIPQAGDYIGTMIGITAPGSGITGTDVQTALNQLAARPAGVASFNGRTNVVVATTGDYSVGMVTGAAPIASPAFTGIPTAPTAAPGTATTQLATTAFVTTAISLYSGVCATCVTTNTVQTITAAKTFTMQQMGGPFVGALTVWRPTTGSGVVTVSAGSNVVTGTTTNFATFLMLGEPITLSDGQQRNIANITSDTAATTTSNWLNTCTNCTYTVTPSTLPLLVRNNYVSIQAPLGIEGFMGNGAIRFNGQSAYPSAVGSTGFALFSTATGRPAWLRSDGFVRSFDSTLTADRTYTWPNASGTVDLLEVAQTFTAAKLFPAGTAAAPSAAIGTSTNGLYSSGVNELGFATNGLSAITIDSSQRVGIGVTPTSTSKVHALGVGLFQFGTGGTTPTLSTQSFNIWNTAAPADYNMFRDDAAGANLVNGDNIGSVRWFARENASYAGVARIDGIYTGNGLTQSGDLSFLTSNAGALTERMRINAAGKIGMGAAPNSGGAATIARLDVQQDATVSDYTAAQFTIHGITNPLRTLAVGYDTTNNRGFIQAAEQGTAYRDLLLSPNGGNTGVRGAPLAGRGMLQVDSGASPLNAQISTMANGAGSLSMFTFGVDNSNLGFDVDYNSGFIARHASVFQLTKNGGVLAIRGSGGNTIGAAATLNSLLTLDTAGALKLTASTGTITERNRAVAMGEWVTPTYAAGNFTGNASMTWTVDAGDVATYEYTLVGKKMTVNYVLKTTTVAGTPNTNLQIAVPGGFTANKETYGFMEYSDNGGARTVSHCFVLAGGTVVTLQTIGATNWATATNTTQVQGTITFEIQ